MKSTGVVRKVDDLGRIVIPKEIRNLLGFNNQDQIEIIVRDKDIVFRKYMPNKACQITGAVSDRNVSFANDKIVLSPEAAETLLQELIIKKGKDF